jgi:hypothetical protein
MTPSILVKINRRFEEIYLPSLGWKSKSSKKPAWSRQASVPILAYAPLQQSFTVSIIKGSPGIVTKSNLPLRFSRVIDSTSFQVRTDFKITKCKTFIFTILIYLYLNILRHYKGHYKHDKWRELDTLITLSPIKLAMEVLQWSCLSLTQWRCWWWSLWSW